jgi:pSer/pThr/pTyr-binding forkhead associated (FHA) protein
MTRSGGATTGDREAGARLPKGASIRVMRGFYEGLELSLDQDWVVIGRGRSADIVLSEPTISRAHAAVGFDGEAFFVQDLSSTNGTGVNGVREPRMELDDGDEILLGKLLLRISLPERDKASERRG